MRNFLLILLIITVSLSGMHIQNSATQIEFQNKKISIGKLIYAYLVNDKHPFSRTNVFRYRDNKFEFQGYIPFLNKKDFRKIYTGNAVYCKDYQELVKTSDGVKFEKVGAIILGTKDIALAYKLHSENSMDSAPFTPIIKSKL